MFVGHSHKVRSKWVPGRVIGLRINRIIVRCASGGIVDLRYEANVKVDIQREGIKMVPPASRKVEVDLQGATELPLFQRQEVVMRNGTTPPRPYILVIFLWKILIEE